MNQREAVFAAVTAIKKVDGHKVELTSDERAKVVTLVCEAFENSEVTFKDTDANSLKLKDEKELKKYVVGLVNNWLRKDPKLNGGERYEAKNPGSRASDPQLKNMQLLLKATADPTKKALIQKHIDARVAEIAAAKAKKVEVDFSFIPEELKEIL